VDNIPNGSTSSFIDSGRRLAGQQGAGDLGGFWVTICAASQTNYGIRLPKRSYDACGLLGRRIRSFFLGSAPSRRGKKGQYLPATLDRNLKLKSLHGLSSALFGPIWRRTGRKIAGPFRRPPPYDSVSTSWCRGTTQPAKSAAREHTLTAHPFAGYIVHELNHSRLAWRLEEGSKTRRIAKTLKPFFAVWAPQPCGFHAACCCDWTRMRGKKPAKRLLRKCKMAKIGKSPGRRKNRRQGRRRR